MKNKSFQLKISEPCHESWNEMTNSEKGRFCQSCQKEVIDFTNLSDRAIAQTFKKAKGNICGRFNNLQLNRSIAHEPTLYQNTRLKVAGLMFSGLLMSSQLAGQTTQNQPTNTEQTNQEPAHSQDKKTIPNIITIKGHAKPKLEENVFDKLIFITNTEISLSKISDTLGNFEIKIDLNRIKNIEKGLELNLTNFTYEENISISKEQLLSSSTIDLGEIVLEKEAAFSELALEETSNIACFSTGMTVMRSEDFKEPEVFITGRVKNKKGEPIGGAKVILTNRKHGLSSFLTKSEYELTTKNGYFEFSVLVKDVNKLRNPLELKILRDGFSTIIDKFSEEELKEDIERNFVITERKERGSITIGEVSHIDYLDDEHDLKTTSTTPHSSIITTKIIKKTYPNPFTNELIVDLENEAAGNYDLILVNELGQEVYRKSIEIIEGNQQIKLELANFSTGVYFLSLLDKEEVLQTETVIKE